MFAKYIKVVFLSAKTKKRIHTLMPEIISAYNNNHKEIKTSLLNEVINDAYNLNLPPSYKGKRLKIYYGTQASTKPPTFVIFVNNKELFHFSYERYLVNQIRKEFGLEGTPVRIIVRERVEK